MILKNHPQNPLFFTVACVDEGGHPEYLGKDDIQLGHKESVEDTARVLEGCLMELSLWLSETVENLPNILRFQFGMA